MRRAMIAASVLAVVAHASSVLALAPLGPPFRVNSFTAGNQGDASYSSCGYGRYRTQAVGSDGSQFIVVWQSDGQDGDGPGVFGQRYDASGTALGTEFQVHASSAGNQTTPVVAMAPSGQFVVAWGSSSVYGGYALDVFARKFDASGTPLGSEFQVSENVYDLGGYPAYRYQAIRNPAIEADAGGKFVVVWEREGFSDDGRDVMGRRLDASGTPLAGTFQVSEVTPPPAYGFYWNRTPDVAVKESGEFVVVWTSIPSAIGGYAIVGRRYDAAGAPLAGEFQVNTQPTYSYNGMSYPVASYFESTPDAVFGGDDFLVTWSSSSMDAEGQSNANYDVAGRFFGAGGAPHGPAFRVNTTTGYSNEGCPTTAHLSAGNFVVAWQRYSYSNGRQAFGQVITPSGTKASVEFVVTADETNGSPGAMPAVAPLGNDFVVAWGHNSMATAWDVYAQRVGEGTGPAATCAPAPMTGCFDATTPKKSVLTFSRRGGDPARGRLRWRWKGEATEAADFGNPKFGTGYAFCLYDASGAPQPVMQAQVAASGMCGTVACWRDLGGNVGGAVQYFLGTTNDDGVLRVRLDPGGADANNVSFQGKGVNLGVPAAALSPTVIAQAQATNGNCWSAQFGGYITKNEPNAFSARSN